MSPLDRTWRWRSAGASLIGLLAMAASDGGYVAVGSERAGGSPASVHSSISMAVGGDVLLGEDINTMIAREGPRAPLAGVPDLRAADIALVNLEGIVAPGADAIDTGRVGDYYFLGRPESLAAIEAAGIDVVATANNHALDFGSEALAAQSRLLDQMQLAHPGTGSTPAEACAPAFLAVRDIVVAVLSVDATTPESAAGDRGSGTCHLTPTDPARWPSAFGLAVEHARARADVVLVMAHFRASFSSEPHPDDRQVARDLVDLGADAVLGVGPHVLQGIEVYAGRPILHSVGTLLFNFPEPDDAAVFLLDIRSTGVVGVRTVPLVIERARTRPADAPESARILAEMDARSRALGTSTLGGVLSLAPPPRDPRQLEPEVLATLDPGPAPGPMDEVPASCQAASIPEGARIDPVPLGPLTLVGARTERTQLDGPTLLWLETFWRATSRPTSDLVIAARATPSRGTTWVSPHEPCDWAWPTSRWEPGVIYRDRYPLRPPVDVQRLAGVPALLTMTGYGSLQISVDVVDDGQVIATRANVRTVVLDPAVPTRIGIVGMVLVSLLAVVAVVRRRRGEQPGE